MVGENNKPFKNRQEAGKALAKYLTKYVADDAIVLALPRGGVFVGANVAKLLRIPLDVIIARKIGLPSNREFGIGAISEENVQLFDDRFIDVRSLDQTLLKTVLKEEQKELQRRIALYRHNKPLPDIENKTVILVDDGVATGVTAKAAIQTLKKLHPKKIIFASPVCAKETAQELRSLVDDVVCLLTPPYLQAIGLWYQNFEEVTDEKVKEALIYVHDT